MLRKKRLLEMSRSRSNDRSPIRANASDFLKDPTKKSNYTKIALKNEAKPVANYKTDYLLPSSNLPKSS